MVLRGAHTLWEAGGSPPIMDLKKEYFGYIWHNTQQFNIKSSALRESTRPPSSKERGKGAAPLIFGSSSIKYCIGGRLVKTIGVKNYRLEGALGKSAISFSEQKIIIALI